MKGETAYAGNKRLAIDLAIKDCLQNDILADFLARHREAAKLMILSEYNEELHKKTLLKEGREEGRREGRDITLLLFRYLKEANRMDDWNKALSDLEFYDKLLEEFHLDTNDDPSSLI